MLITITIKYDLKISENIKKYLFATDRVDIDITNCSY